MKSKSTGHWSDRGENLGTFSLKMGKTLHPTPYTPHPAPTEKLFAANPNYRLLRILSPPPDERSLSGL
ncbi:MAG: hypothetical protein O9332_15750 [Microcystis sp. LE19-10.1B]|uniref:hypothetical protein n=1 Tax=Microcystis sp. LE19-10.1B TaxID=3016428 RepID=UPI0022BD4369|nr:hypothetical protein [Microcystis sp. LE19-10.1B]MCZ8026821.1 hypothetical protein [Microcystis sp. LE19-10.1B]MCZ8361782.1 hypothetical protein [Microcystis sp. LE19-251.1A]